MYKRVLYDIALDLRENSLTYGQYTENILSAENNSILYVPNGIAHGFVVLSEEAGVHYKIDSPYRPDKEVGIRWDDPELDISWPVNDPILSEKDQDLPTFEEAKKGLHFTS